MLWRITDYHGRMDHLVHDLAPDQGPYAKSLKSQNYCYKSVPNRIRQDVSHHQLFELEITAQQVSRYSPHSINDKYH